MSESGLKANKGKSRAIRIKKLAEAWVRDAEEELELTSEDVEPMIEAMRESLNRQIERKPQPAAGQGDDG
jgi:hypothetical protein